ncbi:Lactosylceramide 4-alpha-galactosyltransferase [Portunus trituberculatus]|uniref:Lactosylceramide 4-alpha-galactosyltransferase n=1 Tax=Portunus trituberculatus TaxID=210409 RepID=A0A5B7CK23_PORTR|nr:Lactosylceramide 4-alpha-galactosyltransferase [Portunus trituberculatus]
MVSQWRKMAPVASRMLDYTVRNPLKYSTYVPYSDQSAEGVASMRGVIIISKRFCMLLMLMLAVGSILTFHYSYNKYLANLQDATIRLVQQGPKLHQAWPVELLSDMLRVLVLWWWGGVYSDTDVISVQSLTLPDNSLGFEHSKQLGSAFYSFQARHPVLLSLMKDMHRNFKVFFVATQSFSSLSLQWLLPVAVYRSGANARNFTHSI